MLTSVAYTPGRVPATRCGAKGSFLVDPAADAVRGTLHEVEDQRQAWKQLVEFGKVLPDDGLLFMWYPRLVQVL